MNIVLGIDTGGTYTDAVLVNHATGEVLAGAKALTTRHDLTEGIGAALAATLTAYGEHGATIAPTDIALVAVSTTLATNALAEGHSSAVTLFLIGYDEDLMRQYGFNRQLSTEDVVYLRGGHNDRGEEVAELDVDQLCREVKKRLGATEAYAVSGYFGVRNPAHELRAREIIAALSGRPVTCGHELSSRLNAVRRATTAALNAHLVLPLTELITSVRHTLDARGIAAPLMVVKGDGSLMRAGLALQRPIETILSGPAASVVGAWHLAGRRDVWVVDVGGTTTDIAALRDGLPRLNAEGAEVGGWRTMVEAIDVHTTGLGGDSHVRADREGELLIGPGRVIPLSFLASQYPRVVAELTAQLAAPGKSHLADAAQFLVTGRRPAYDLPADERELLELLVAGPQPLASLVRMAHTRGIFRRTIEHLEQRGLARRSAFTPTDALHVLGRFRPWDVEAAQLGAALHARRLGGAPGEFAERVIAVMSDRIATELVTKVLDDAGSTPAWEREPTAAALVRYALNGRENHELGCRFTLRRPIVAIGAPVEAYLPAVADKLTTELVVPRWPHVANAVGAVAGSITQRARVSILPIDQGERYRVYLPDGIHDFDHLEAAVACAREVMSVRVQALARDAGAEEIETQVTRRDDYAPLAGNADDQLYLGTELSFVATGRPALGVGAPVSSI